MGKRVSQSVPVLSRQVYVPGVQFLARGAIQSTRVSRTPHRRRKHDMSTARGRRRCSWENGKGDNARGTNYTGHTIHRRNVPVMWSIFGSDIGANVDLIERHSRTTIHETIIKHPESEKSRGVARNLLGGEGDTNFWRCIKCQYSWARTFGVSGSNGAICGYKTIIIIYNNLYYFIITL